MKKRSVKRRKFVFILNWIQVYIDLDARQGRRSTLSRRITICHTLRGKEYTPTFLMPMTEIGQRLQNSSLCLNRRILLQKRRDMFFRSNMSVDRQLRWKGLICT